MTIYLPSGENLNQVKKSLQLLTILVLFNLVIRFLKFPVIASQILIIVSSDIDVSIFLSGKNLIDVTICEWCIVFFYWVDDSDRSHILIILLLDAKVICRLSGEKLSDSTNPVWPFNMFRSVLVLTSYTRISLKAHAIFSLLGENVTNLLRGPSIICIKMPVLGS